MQTFEEELAQFIETELDAQAEEYRLLPGSKMHWHTKSWFLEHNEDWENATPYPIHND